MDLSPQKPPVAVLIDADNLSHSHAQMILSTARRYGEPAIRRAYGKPEATAPWTDHGFRLNTTRPGKNAADLLLTVEAMSLALKDHVKTLIIASSDADFSYLASHLREQGHKIIGMGEGKTPAAFRNACADFALIGKTEPSVGAQHPPPHRKTDLADWVLSRLAQAGKGGLAITELNTEAQRAGFQISTTPEKSWRTWLQAESRKTLLRCDPKGPNARVRSLSPAPHSAP